MDIAFKVTTNGRAVLAACMSDGNALQISGVDFGKGLVPEGTDLANVHALVDEVADGTIAEWYHEGEQLHLTAQYANISHPEVETFYISEFIVWAINPDTSEPIDLIYGTLGDYTQPVPQYDASLPSSTFSFPMVIVVSSDVDVDVTANPGLLTYDDLARYVAENFVARLRQSTIVLPTVGWTEDSSVGGEDYPYYIDVASTGITATVTPVAVIVPASEAAAVDCGLSPSCQCISGYTRFFSNLVPSTAITVNVSYIGS